MTGRRWFVMGMAWALGRGVGLAQEAPLPFNALNLSPLHPRFEATLGGRRWRGELFLREGMEGKALPLSAFRERRILGAAHWQAEVELPEAQLALRFEGERRGAWQGVSVALMNRSLQPRLLEVGWRVEGEMGEARFYGGMGVRSSKGRHELEGSIGPFPMVVLFDSEAALAIGYDPEQWLSYLHHMVDLSSPSVTLLTSTRLVLDSEGETTLRFVLGAWSTRWGHLEALHHYYQAFPRWFRPTPGVDGRVFLNGGSYLAWRDRPHGELCRRLRVGWEWCYAPFKRTGDIYGRPEFWEYQPARPHDPVRRLPLPEYHEWRRRRFEGGRLCDVLMLFYIPSQIWCEEQLARERYADSLTTDPRVRTFFDRPWVTGPDNELRVFPLRTSFGEQTLRDMQAVVEELDLEGFAFDVADGGARYYGPAAKDCPGRAWDERGIFVDEGVAIAHWMDWVHRQRRGGRPLAVVINPGPYPIYLTAFRCDASMLESTPLTVHEGIADGLRYRLGHKPMVFWETYEYEEWLREDLTRLQCEEALRGLADYTVLACLREVALPTPRIALGLGPVVRWLPTLGEMVQAGWQPVPAAECPAGLWASRAGEGLSCWLATGNETAEEVVSTLEIEDRWIGFGRRFLWRRWDGEPVAHRLTTKATTVPFALPSRQPLVLRTAAAWQGSVEGWEGTVRWREDLHRAWLLIEGEGRTGKGWLVLAEPKGWRIEGVSLDGRSLQVERTQEGPRVRLAWHGRHRLEAVFVSDLFTVSRQELFAFPWLRGEEVAFRIVADTSHPQVADAAHWLAEYFPVYFAEAMEPSRKIEKPPIVSLAGEGTGPVVRLLWDQRQPRPILRLRSPQELEIAAPSPEALKEAVKRLLSVLDERFFWPGPLPNLPLFQRVGLAGRFIGS